MASFERYVVKEASNHNLGVASKELLILKVRVDSHDRMFAETVARFPGNQTRFAEEFVAMLNRAEG